MPTRIDKQADELAKSGKLIEAGFIMQVMKNAPDDVPPAVTRMIRSAFFFGARHMLEVMLAAQTLGEDDMAEIAANVREEFDKFAAAYNDFMTRERHH